MTDIFIALSRNAVTDCAAPAVPCDITINTVNLGRCYNACVTVSALCHKELLELHNLSLNFEIKQ